MMLGSILAICGGIWFLTIISPNSARQIVAPNESVMEFQNVKKSEKCQNEEKEENGEENVWMELYKMEKSEKEREMLLKMAEMEPEIENFLQRIVHPTESASTDFGEHFDNENQTELLAYDEESNLAKNGSKIEKFWSSIYNLYVANPDQDAKETIKLISTNLLSDLKSDQKFVNLEQHFDVLKQNAKKMIGALPKNSQEIGTSEFEHSKSRFGLTMEGIQIIIDAVEKIEFGHQQKIDENVIKTMRSFISNFVEMPKIIGGRQRIRKRSLLDYFRCWKGKKGWFGIGLLLVACAICLIVWAVVSGAHIGS